MASKMLEETILDVQGMSEYFYDYKGFPIKKLSSVTKAVDNVSFQIRKGETLGLVGESGCGKSTLGRTIVGMYRATQGQILFRGEDVGTMSRSQLRGLSTKMQMIFQDPYSSINPKKKISSVLNEPLVIHKLYSRVQREERIRELMQMVGLDENFLDRYPHEFSGGQRQRVGIARALALNPELIVCDEAVSALDVSIQAQVINLLANLQKKLGLSYLFISHNLAVVKHISDRVAVMYLGQIVELADKDALYTKPLHPYTIALVSAATVPHPVIERQRQKSVLPGEPPSSKNPPSGCRFHPRCRWATEQCRTQAPLLVPQEGTEHWVACHRVGQLT